MRLKELFMGLLVCAALPACTDDADSVGNKLTEGKAYIKVQIAMPSTSTRATEGDYENGSDTEQKISDLYFAFYDNDGNFMADGKNVQNLIPSQQAAGSNVEAITDAVIALELEEKDDFPTQVVAYVNTPRVNNVSIFAGKSLDEARKMIEESTTYATDNKFMMTNSTYYQGGEKFATPVVPANFYETEEMARADDNPVEIYVERLAAKVRVAAATDVEIADLTDKSGNTLKFTITTFALNATNTKAYYLKHIPSGWTDSNPTWTWNKAADFRCFWAEDVNYTATTDGDLTFVSYNDVEANTTSFSAYCRENTFAYTSMVGENVNPYKIATHALVLGKYVVTNKDGQTIGDATGTFYMYGGTVYDADNLKKLLAPISLVFTKSEGDVYETANPSVYDIVAVTGSASDVCLHLTLTEETTYYTKSGDTFVAIDEANLSTVNTALAQVKAEGFNAGLAYFPVIIEHFGGVAGTDGNEKTGDGAYGVVRNHIYDLTIQSIKSLGTGIFDETQPIIPDGSTKKYYVGAKLNILSWKVVQQNVNL